VEADAESEGSIEEELVEYGSPDAAALACGEDGFGCSGMARIRRLTDESNAAEGAAGGLEHLLSRRLIEIDA
jgi:hypothetical protein